MSSGRPGRPSRGLFTAEDAEHAEHDLEAFSRRSSHSVLCASWKHAPQRGARTQDATARGVAAFFNVYMSSVRLLLNRIQQILGGLLDATVLEFLDCRLQRLSAHVL
jgi:hypothetical protein